jgi:glutamate---methylamine ligase
LADVPDVSAFRSGASSQSLDDDLSTRGPRLPRNDNLLAQIAKAKGIKYFLFSCVDLSGVLRAKLVPARAIRDMQKNGAGFAGFASWLDVSPADPDMFAMPDPESLIQLPWDKDVASVASDLWLNGKVMDASPRAILKRQVATAEKLGYHMQTGVECEYFLTNPEETAISDPADTQSKPCYDQQALMRRYPVASNSGSWTVH